ncbi:MAG: hypothetical protein AMJ91_03910 [candidate division Zixibacteria bacterium SM23_73_3]|nr:MAG: hypothetical protein AMJ91_03910 [candidate division Zixibacteria bacterium SM23_73_3]
MSFFRPPEFLLPIIKLFHLKFKQKIKIYNQKLQILCDPALGYNSQKFSALGQTSVSAQTLGR